MFSKIQTIYLFKTKCRNKYASKVGGFCFLERVPPSSPDWPSICDFSPLGGGSWDCGSVTGCWLLKVAVLRFLH